MAETAEATAPVVELAPPTAVAQPEPLTEQGKQVAQILTMAEADPEFAKKPEVVALKAKVAELQSKKTAPTTDAKLPATQAAEPPVEETTEGEQEKKSIFRSNKVATPAEFKDINEYSSHLEKNFGIKDPAKFAESATKWRNDSQQLTEVSDRAAGLEKVFTELPDVLYDAIQVWGKGQDWMGSLKDGLPNLDYNKGFDKQVNTVVNHYFKGKFTDEQLNDTTDPIVSNAIDVAKTKFDLEKNQIESKRAATLERAEATAKAVKASVVGSVEKIEESFPEFDTRKKSEIKQLMLSGDLNSLFYKKDGTFKPEAAKMLAFALYGEEEITGQVSKASTKAASKATTKALMETVNRGSEKPPATTQQTAAMPETPKEVEAVLKGLNRKTYY
jgi:hypothetical protein